MTEYYNMVTHEKVDLLKRVGYEYNIMTLVGYDKNTRPLIDRPLWWKAYNEHVIEEIRQLRGRMSTGTKTNMVEGEYLIKHIFVIMLLY